MCSLAFPTVAGGYGGISERSAIVIRLADACSPRGSTAWPAKCLYADIVKAQSSNVSTTAYRISAIASPRRLLGYLHWPN